MKETVLAFLVLSMTLSCGSAPKNMHGKDAGDSTMTRFDSLSHAIDTSNQRVLNRTDSTFRAIAANESADSATPDSLPPAGLRTDSIIYVADTTTAAIMKALYYTTTGKGDSTQGISVKNDYPGEDALAFTDRDTALMSILEHTTYREHNTLIYFAILYGYCGYAPSNHLLYAYAYVFLHLTPQGWLVQHVQLDNNADLDDHSLSYLADGSLIYSERTVHNPDGGEAWIYNSLSYVHDDSVTLLYNKLTGWTNGASGCADKIPCNCFDGEIDMHMTRAKGAPYFLITEDSSSTIFSKKTCRETGKVHTINISACVDGDMVLLNTRNKNSGKTKVFVKNTPADIMKAFKKHRRSNR